MKSKAIKLLHVEELGYLSSCIREAYEYMEANNDMFIKHIGVSCEYSTNLCNEVNEELVNRPNYLDDSEPWVANPSLSDMSNDAISLLTTKELLCFSNCIAATLEYLDNEDQFNTRVGGPTKFARIFKSALDLELSNRSNDHED